MRLASRTEGCDDSPTFNTVRECLHAGLAGYSGEGLPALDKLLK
ncbi:hypothetical protein M2103_000232 [Ereboglobus sp. PH5-5]|nr:MULTISPECIES: hypothetical protein [unclassified Ereboglobus]MDF9827006.1 hypothetical protein [Ereboglobus sp. PH5-10]MDF9832028.1 hypothetical protein [Ereboglobus sp. PH5-5]